MKIQCGKGVIEIKQADITQEPVDAIVNAANTRLRHGGGVAGAIVQRGGRVIQDESDEIGHCATGDAVVTSAGTLPCRHVIHTVGPINGQGNEEPALRAATRTSLLRARELGAASIAFPAISTGIYGYPMTACARIMLAETRAFLEDAPGTVVRVVFCLFDQQAYEVFQAALEDMMKREQTV